MPFTERNHKDIPWFAAPHDTCATAVAAQGRYRIVLWIVLAINAVMFAVEIGAGLVAGSAALLADALDFFADAANYAISLFVLGMALTWRAWAALVKGLSMAAFGLWVIGTVVWHAVHGTVPDWATMGKVGLLALIANAACLALLTAWRDGDANMRSVWICSRNDVVANMRGSGGGLRRLRHRAPAGRISPSPPLWPCWRCRARLWS